MTTKEKILQLFEKERGIYFSGEKIAQILGISRAAVWKAVKSLREDGYSIDAVTNRGYCLSEKTDILSSQGVQKYLKYPDITVSVLNSAVSTNDLVRIKANQGYPEGYTLLANEQTAGRGRAGRSFYSPADTGIYMSVLLRPRFDTPQQSLKITTMAAAAMCESIREISGLDAGIKWVNDILINNRKVCGILTEGSFDMENGQMEYAVLGLGVNLYQPEGGFPDFLQKSACSIFSKSQQDAKNRLTATFLNHFFSYYFNPDQCEYLKKYRNYSTVIGKKITVFSRNIARKATVLSLDEACRLCVEYEDGTNDQLSYGEIKILN